MKIVNFNNTNKTLIVCFVISLYYSLLCPFRLMSQNVIAQYPFFMHQFNRNFLYLSYWDVTGNARHGNSYNPNAVNGFAKGGRPGLYFENQPSELPKSKEWKDFRLRQGFFYESGKNDSIPCLKKMVGDDAFVTIPKPKIASYLNFSIAFWIKPDDSPELMNVYRDNRFEVFLSKTCLKLRIFNADGLPQTKNYYFLITQPFLSNGDWWFVNINCASGEYKMQAASNPNEIRNIELFNQIFDQSPPINDNYRAYILDNNFGGEVFNFRFADGILNTYTCMNQDLNFLHKKCVEATTGAVVGANYLIDNALAYYPLNGNSFKDWLINKKGANAFGIGYGNGGSITTTTDRFNTMNGALNFSGISNMTLFNSTHDFFKGYLDGYLPFVEPVTPDVNGNCGNFTNPKGITFSFWVKITDNLSSPKSVNSYMLPYTNTDPKFTFFCGVNSIGQKMCGIQRINDRIGLYRVTRIQNRPIDPWYLWCYDPVNFTNKQGWYHIVLSQEMDWLKLYVFKPGDTKPQIQVLYMELDRLDEITNWMIGSQTNNGPGSIDDFRVYNWPLYESEVIALHQIESTPPASGAVQIKTTVVPETNKGLKPSFNVYPNPATDELTAKIVLSENADVQLSLCDLKGIDMYRRTLKLEAGITEIPIEIKNISRGEYIMKAITPSKTYVTKVIFK